MLALNSNTARTNHTRIENVNSLFVTKWNKIIWIDTYTLINLTDTSIIILSWDFSLNFRCWKLFSLGAGIQWNPASLTQFGFCRRKDLPNRAQYLFTGPSLFLPTPCLEGLSPGYLLGVCSAEAVQGFTFASFSYFLGIVSFLSLLITLPSIKALAFLFSMSNPRKIFWAMFS